ncbi:MAG: NAD(P)H-hydrate dehydratase [Phycisphaerales bacterium]
MPRSSVKRPKPGNAKLRGTSRRASAALPTLPARTPTGHKGTFGTVCILGGNCAGATRMVGAPALSALAALRSGCGLAKVFAPAPICADILTIVPSATGHAIGTDLTGETTVTEAHAAAEQALRVATVIAIGPGLGRGPGPAAALSRLLDQTELPLVIDADALAILAAFHDPTQSLRATAVLTPHPGEFRRLAESLDLDTDPIDPAKRPAAARALAAKLNCVVVLKGAGTIIADRDSAFTNTTGNAALATGGTGDVLTGLIAGLVAQSPAADLLDTARLAVHIHGLAADLWVKRHGAASGLLAAELADLIPAAMQSLRRK